MSYFSKMPVVLYDFTVQGDKENRYLTLADVTTRVDLKMSPETEDLVSDLHTIREWDTPRSISRMYYGTDEYYWLIMYMNNINDLLNDWPMNEVLLVDFCLKKYPGEVKEFRPGNTVSIYVNGINSSSYQLQVSTESLPQIGSIIPGSYIELKDYLLPDTKITSIAGNVLTLDKYPIVTTEVALDVPVAVKPVIPSYLGLHHYENDQGSVCGETYTTGEVENFGVVDGTAVYEYKIFDAAGVSNYDYEQKLNEAKRVIKIIKPRYISEVMARFDKAMFK